MLDSKRVRKTLCGIINVTDKFTLFFIFRSHNLKEKLKQKSKWSNKKYKTFIISFLSKKRRYC